MIKFKKRVSIGGSHMMSSNYDQYAINFDVGYKFVQRISVPNLKLFRPIKTKLSAKGVEKFSVIFYGKICWWAFFRPSTWLL